MRRIRHATLLLGLSALVLGGCDPNSERAFIHGRAYDPCEQVIPSCEGGLYASCSLDGSRYTEQRFPGALRFVVRAEPEDEIEIGLYFADITNTGLETSIYWYEPGCSEVYSDHTDGPQIVEEAKASGSVWRSQKVYESGEHLVEILSDAQARVVVAVTVREP